MQVLKEDIRGRILTIARQQFEKKGYSKTSMREIAELSSVGVGNIYNYFTSKDELFREVVRPVLCALEAMLQEHNGIRGEDIMMMRSEKYLKSCIDEYVSLIDKHRSLMEILLFRAQGSSLERFRENYTDRSTELVKAWFAALSSGESRGILPASMRHAACLTQTYAAPMRYSAASASFTGKPGVPLNFCRRLRSVFLL